MEIGTGRAKKRNSATKMLYVAHIECKCTCMRKVEKGNCAVSKR